MASSLITSWQVEDEYVETVTNFLVLGSKITADDDCSHEIRRQFLLSRKSMTNLDSVLKSRHYFADRGPCSQGYGLSRSHALMWELDNKEGRVPKNWCFWTVVLEKTLESPFESKEIKPIKVKSILNTLWKDWFWSWTSNNLATWCKEPTQWKRPWCWEKLKAEGEEGSRGWDG